MSLYGSDHHQRSKFYKNCELHDSQPNSAEVVCEWVLTRLKLLSVRDKTPQCILYVFKTLNGLSGAAAL